jgi:hypothetical protein
MVPVDSVGVSRDPTYSGIPREATNFHVRDCHPLWSAFPCRSVSYWLCNSHVKDPTTPQRKTSAVWAVSRSLAATDEIDFSFSSSGYLDVSVHRVSRRHLWIQYLLIRESRDQCLFDNYPWLFAVFHARHRLLMPRHPPCALISLTTNIQNSHPQPTFRTAAESTIEFNGSYNSPNRPSRAGLAAYVTIASTFISVCQMKPFGFSQQTRLRP